MSHKLLNRNRKTTALVSALLCLCLLPACKPGDGVKKGDKKEESAKDSRLIKVNAGGNQVIVDTDKNGSETVKFKGEVDSKHPVKKIQWLLNDKVVATTLSFKTNLSVGVHVAELRVTDNKSNSSNDKVKVTIKAPTAEPADTQAPSAPQNLSAVPASSSQINISYSASTDNVGVAGYRIERCQGANCTNFAQVATPAGLAYSNTTLAANTLYRYRVRSADAAGNLSAYSAIAQATTEAGANPPNYNTVFDCNSGNFVGTVNASAAPCAVDLTGYQNPPNGFEIHGSFAAEASVVNGRVYLSKNQNGGGHLGTNMVYQHLVNVRAFETTFKFVANGKNIALVLQNTSYNSWGFYGKNFDSGAGCEVGFFQAFDTSTPDNIFALAIMQDQPLVGFNPNNPGAFVFSHSSVQIYKEGETPCTGMWQTPQWTSGQPFSVPTQISTAPLSLNMPASQPLTTTGHEYEAKINYDGSKITLNLRDVTAGGTCTGTSNTGCFTHTWNNVNIPALVNGDKAWVSLSAGCNSDCPRQVNVNSFKYAAP